MPNPTSETMSPEMTNALSALGKMLNIASVYGMKHPSMARPLKEAHQLLSEALKQEKKVSLGLFNQTLTVNDKMVTDYTVHLRALERKFVSQDIPHLIFHIGLSENEFEQFVNALCEAGARSGESIKDQLDKANLDHIKADAVEYVAQHEGQRLVGADENGKDLGSGGKESKTETEPAAEINIGQIVAFLKGDPASAGASPGEDMQKILSDPEKLGQLIMDSISVRQSMQAVDSGESLADIVVGCLRRTYEGLARQKKFQSSRGKASLHKAMLLLEKTVVDKIRDSIGEEQPDVDEQILEALHEAEEKRQVEILAARFAEQQKKMTKTELDLLNYIRENGEERARALLDCTYIAENDWNRLTTRARQAGGPGSGSKKGSGDKIESHAAGEEKEEPASAETDGKPGEGETGSGTDGQIAAGGTSGEIGGGDVIDMGALAIVLDKLETIMDLGNMPPEIVKSAVQNVREESNSVSEQLEKQVKKVEADVKQYEEDTAKAPEERTGKKSRADILLELSQLALKLAQPLTVITASIEGAIMSASDPALVCDLLEMADESSKQMQELMKRLTSLVGYPSMQEADKNILLY